MTSRLARLFAAASLVAVAGCGGRAALPASSTPSALSTDSPSVGTPGAAVGGDRPTAPAIDVPSNLDDLIASANASPPEGPDRRVFGADASWPQCPEGMGLPQKRSKGAPMPTSAAEFVVLGLTNGPSFTTNPCLADQVQWVRDRGLLIGAYAVVSWPSAAQVEAVGTKGPFDGTTRLGALRNTGYQAGLFTLATMREAGLKAPAVWIDVEPVPDFDWSPDLAANAAIVEGTARAYTDSGLRIGYYSVASLWQRVVGNHRTGERPSGARPGRPRWPRRSGAAARTRRSVVGRRSWRSGSRTTATATSPAPARVAGSRSGSPAPDPPPDRREGASRVPRGRLACAETALRACREGAWRAPRRRFARRFGTAMVSVGVGN